LTEYIHNYEPVIGLEVHAQMKTKSKAFCSCSTAFNSPPNTNVCPICLGHPGTLPVVNKSLVDFILKLGLATECKITEHSIFARKNYFYPDLPKGYQISQFDRPICHDGYVEIKGQKIGITRIHMEEDAGKSIHDFADDETLVDLNRCGVPLIEIVSEPDLRSPEQAYDYLIKLKQLVQYLDICDGNMEEGSLRCDANVSIRLNGESKFGIKTEVKNLNSFKNVSDALNAEIIRQSDILNNGGEVIHQTLTYDARTKTTFAIRTKEEAHDYRYFPEPDLVGVYVNEGWIKEIKSTLPELPDKRKTRLVAQYFIPEYDAEVLTQDRDIANYYEKICSNLNSGKSYKNASNWVMTEIMRILNENKIVISEFWVTEENVSSLIKLIDEGMISNNIAKEVYLEMVKIKDRNNEKQKPEFIVKEKNLLQICDESEIERIIKNILNENPKEVERYRKGETKLLGMFVGKVMKESKGKANPKTVNELLSKILK
jgi:aspartyl-tRNA(Asn)/glutamyl-tRNA(Gln) amidotransferase subunit B